jgi:hypothetical protein
MKKLAMIIAATMVSGAALAGGGHGHGGYGHGYDPIEHEASYYDDNKSLIYVTDESSYNTVNVYQSSYSKDADNMSKVTIDHDSDGNNIYVKQVGSKNKSEVKVDDYSDHNVVSNVQYGYKNTAKTEIDDSSSYNNTNTMQTGAFNKSKIEIEEYANGNNVSLSQDGYWNDADVYIKHGDDNHVYGDTKGNGNKIDVDILGGGADYNLVSISQYGDDSKARVLVDDEYNGYTAGNHVYINQTSNDYSYVKVSDGSSHNYINNVQL